MRGTSEWTKSPWETITISFDASNTVASDDSIASVAVTVEDSDGTDVSSTMVEGTPSFSGTTISATIKAGTDGEDYVAFVRITTTAGEQIEDSLYIFVREEPDEAPESETRTLAEMLADVNAAIRAVLSGTGQEYRIGDKMYRRADLDSLRSWRKDLQREIALESGKTGNKLRVFVGRSGR